ncbi:solute carrier family 15 member 2 isoform X2 [Folsomia candida]|uniref:solute carrier family 15 member 2 isoform X2 n=1 Tax=Folsomia candida TaxID=158441 RepID=UPI001604DC56|nr:solute carrier family 15 member 2 isoform X2 [Folsomia candida]
MTKFEFEKDNNPCGNQKAGESYCGTDTFYLKDVETDSTSKKLRYPKQVWFILANEFCERFSYYGMKAVLTIYLVNVLAYSPDSATKLYHIFSGFCYFTPLFGAMIADSFLGKFRTILYLSIVYSLGNVILSLAATPPLNLPDRTFSLIGLGLIAIGTGGIKPCVSSFGGDQFILPQQERHLGQFFSIFYFSINAGSLISTFVTPIFRKDIACFESDTCYPLAFGVPAALMIAALAIFILGRPMYTLTKPAGNLVLLVIKCVSHAISRKRKLAATGDKREHFLDYADDKFDKKLLNDVKALLRILFLYIPLPAYWSLFDQQGSRWTLQATRMDGKFFGYLIKPDQMQVVNPFLILALIPIFDKVIYPTLRRGNILTRPLQRLTTGGILAGIAFIISGILELHLEPTYAVTLGPSESQVHFINTLPCNLNLTFNGELGSRGIESFDMSILSKISAGKYDGKVEAIGECDLLKNNVTFSFIAEEQKAFTYMIKVVNGSIEMQRDKSEDELEKSKEGNPKLKVIISGMLEEVNLNATLLLINEKQVAKHINLQNDTSTVFLIDPNMYHFKLFIPSNETVNRLEQSVNISGTIDLHLGGNYILTLSKDLASGQISTKSYTITEPNSVHMLWLLPQYIVITISEVMFSVTGLEFSFSQAPVSMKAVIQAAWLLTVAFGNIIVVFIAEFIKFDKQSKEFFLFAGLMFADMTIFGIMAYFYKPIDINANEGEEDESRSNIPMQPPNVFDNSTFRKEE